jgi:signal transduction histidine kinase
VATAALAASLAAGAALLLAVTHRSGLATVDGGAAQVGREVADLYLADKLPVPIPATGATAVYVQVIGDGQVVAASATADRLVPLLRPDEIARVRAGERLNLPGDRAGIDSPIRVVGVRAGPATVVVAVGTEQLADSERIVRRWVRLTAPGLLAVLAVLTWLLVGWTLRPVEALRRGAADISGRNLDERLPVPQAGDEISRLAATLNDMLDRIDASRRRQRSFVSDAAHELRSPLASIRTQLEVAQRTGDWDQAVPDLLAEVDRLARLVNDLLLLARLDEARAGGTRPAEPMELGELAADLAGRYAGARVPVQVDRPARPLPVHGDPDGLRRLVTNLLDNAVRHAESRVSVRMAAEDSRDDVPGSAGGGAGGSGAGGRDDGRWVQLTVQDDGPGIPAADRERVFDRFARLDDARSRDAGGSGLGLPIARNLARAHGGTLTLEDAAPGVRAVLRLPLPASGR